MKDEGLESRVLECMMEVPDGSLNFLRNSHVDIRKAVASTAHSRKRDFIFVQIGTEEVPGSI